MQTAYIVLKGIVRELMDGLTPAPHSLSARRHTPEPLDPSASSSTPICGTFGRMRDGACRWSEA